MADDKTDPFANALDNHLIERRAVFLRGQIDQELAENVRGRLLLLQSMSSDPIHLLIDSIGGSLAYALRISDFISHVITAPVHGIVIGDCLSGATLILLHCTTRVSTPNATFLIHSGTMFQDVTLRVDKTTHRNMHLMYKDYMKNAEEMMKVYMAKLHLSRQRVQKLIQRGDQDFDSKMCADEALKIGLIQEILEGKLDIFEPHSLILE